MTVWIMRIGRAVPLGSVALSAVMTPGCSSPPPPEEAHPQRTGFVHPIPASDTIHLPGSDPIHGAPALPRTPFSLPDLRGTTLGAESTPEDQVFGAISSIAIVPDGRVLVLDPQAREVRVFRDTEPALPALQTLGGHGSGPGEFLTPRTLVLGPGEHLWVLEIRGDASVFRLNGDSVEFSHRVRLGREVWDACILEERLYVHGMRGGDRGAVHVYDMEGRWSHSFGEIYRTTNPIVRHQLSQGHIACVDNPPLVLVAPAHLPELRAYDPEGRLLWWVSLTGFRPLGISSVQEPRTGRRGSRMTFPSEGWHSIVGLVASSEQGAALVQVRTHVVEEHPPPGAPGLQTFVVDLRARRSVPAHGPWPRVVSWSPSRILAIEEDPYPSLVRFEVGRR